MTWTAADAAEQDVLVDELVRCYIEHRQECEACQPCQHSIDYLEHRQTCWKCKNGIRFTTEWYGHPCPHYLAHITHTCRRCEPCEALKTAIDIVLEWRRRRELLSRAEEFRFVQQVRDAAA